MDEQEKEFVPQFVDMLPPAKTGKIGTALSSAIKAQEFASTNPGVWCVIAIDHSAKGAAIANLRQRLMAYNKLRGVTGVELVVRKVGSHYQLYCRHEKKEG